MSKDSRNNSYVGNEKDPMSKYYELKRFSEQSNVFKLADI